MSLVNQVYQEGPGGEIVLYRIPDGETSVNVRLVKDTVWLNLNQITVLFGRDKSVISRHLRKIFSDGELDRRSVVAFFATTAADGKIYQIEHFNLDAIISVGYRVNSKRGVQFRIWATRVLREHLLKGYTVNQRRLEELKQTIRLVAQIADRRQLDGDEATSLLRVIADYSTALEMLDDYDHNRIRPPSRTKGKVIGLNYDEVRRIVDRLREEFGGSRLFGKEKDQGLRSSLAAVMQTFGGRDLYPGIEEKGAHLLYFLVKDHVFIDGNKRIAAALFLWFMEKNGALYRKDGSRRIANNALVAMTLLIAESHPREKDILCNVLMHLIAAKES